MKWNALLHSPYEQPAPPSRRWWLGWLQLLCAWVLCMLLCANIALVLAKGLPEETSKVTVGKTVACMAAETATPPGMGRSSQADGTKGRTLPCKAPRERIFAL